MGHLQDIDESYSDHFKFAGKIGFMLLKAGFAALIHAVVPVLFVTTASETIKEINAILVERNADPDAIDEDNELFI